MNRLFNPLYCTLYAIIYLHLSILRHIARYPFEQSKTNSLFLSMPGSYTIGISYLSVTHKKSILILFACSFTGLKLSLGNYRKCIIITVCIITFFLMIIKWFVISTIRPVKTQVILSIHIVVTTKVNFICIMYSNMQSKMKKLVLRYNDIWKSVS